MPSQHPYEALTPDWVLNAIESTGLISDARILALNSYENRVYQVGIESKSPIIAKFYRPDRWSDEQIIEEHQFTLALRDLDISVVAPFVDEQGNSLHRYEGFRFALYERQGGHAPNLDDMDTLLSLGRTLGRLHALGKEKAFLYRPEISWESFGQDSMEFLMANNFIPASLEKAYSSLTQDLLAVCKQKMQMPYNKIRLHGDCHPGNILWRHDTAHFVDFDDARNGPAI